MKEKIIELRKRGYSYNQIKEELKCSKSTISYHCSTMMGNDERVKGNLDIKNKKQEKEKSFLIENCDIEKVIKLRKDKKTYKEIKEITYYTLYTISKICREYGLVGSRKYGKITESDIIEIQLEYDKLKSVRKVSKKLCFSRDSIMKYANIIRKEKKTDEEIKKQRSQSVISWRKRVKIKLVEYKGGKCERCNYNKSTRSLDFHHLDPIEKDFTISGKSWSFERLKKEVDKCILICRNCHGEIHDEIEKEKLACMPSD